MGRFSSQRLFALLASLVVVAVFAGDAVAASPLVELQTSADVTVDFNGVISPDQGVVIDDRAGLLTASAIPGIDGAADLDGYHQFENGDQLFSLNVAALLPGGVVASPGDVVRYDGMAFTLEFDGAALGLDTRADVDALSVTSGGDLLLSFATNVAIDGVIADDEDVVRFDGVDFYLFLDGATAGLTSTLDIDALHYLEVNQHLLISFDTSGSIGGVSFNDEDLLEYDPSGGVWELAYDGSAEQSEWVRGDLDAAFGRTPDPAGAIPDGGDIPGRPLTLDKSIGEEVVLTWSPSCIASDLDYAIYEGTLGDFSSHVPVNGCSTAGATSLEINLGAGSRYYLIVPQGSATEGSYGNASDGTPRPSSPGACQAALVLADICP